MVYLKSVVRDPPVVPGATRSALLKALQRGPRTAQALAREVGVDTAAARRHLDPLVAAGLLAAAFRQEGLGRPKKYYELTDAGRETFPRRYDVLLERLVAAVERREGEDGLGALMDDVASELAEEAASRVPAGAPLRDRVRALAGVLRAMGFPTEIEEREGRIVIVRRDCVFLKLARAHEEAVCGRLDTAFLSRVLGRPVELAACLPWGDAACRHVVHVGARGRR